MIVQTHKRRYFIGCHIENFQNTKHITTENGTIIVMLCGFILIFYSELLHTDIKVNFIFFSAGFIALTSIIMVDLVGLEKLTNSFGLIILFRGAAACVGTPLAGILRDITNSYTVPFFVAGGLFGLSSLISFMIPVVRRITKNKNKVQDDEAMVPMNTKNQH